MSSKTLNTRILSRYDTYANWIEKDPVLMAGELAVVVIPTDAGSGVNEPSILLKVGDGTKKFSELGWLSGLSADVYDWAKAENKPSYEVSDITGLEDALAEAGTAATYYEKTSVEEMEAIESPKHGDVCIVKTAIGSSDKVSYTAYVYDTDKWAAMDGNYSADNVYLKDDITLAGSYTAVGNITKSYNGTSTLSAAGKSVATILQEIFTKRLQPNVTKPSIKVGTANGTVNTTAEIGSNVIQSYSVTFVKGSYTYGPSDTGVTPTSYSVKTSYSNDDIKTTASGTWDQSSIALTENPYYVIATVEYSDGVVALDNLGDASSPEKKITAGSITANSPTVTSYRNYFYGVLDNTNDLNSTVIRGLTKSNKAAAAGDVFTLTGDAIEGAKRMVIAIPTASGRTVKSVILTSAMNTDITATYVKQADKVQVEGANGYTAVDYDIYIYEPASIASDEVHEITLG